MKTKTKKKRRKIPINKRTTDKLKKALLYPEKPIDIIEYEDSKYKSLNTYLEKIFGTTNPVKIESMYNYQKYKNRFEGPIPWWIGPFNFLFVQWLFLRIGIDTSTRQYSLYRCWPLFNWTFIPFLKCKFVPIID